MKYKKTKEDFIKHMKSQMRFLELSCKSYDDGFEDEAQRLATALRVLLHDTCNSTSLLQHLGLKKQIYFISSVHQYIPANSAPYLGFLTLRLENCVGGDYLPNCLSDGEMPNKWLTFDDWWNEIVIDDKNNLFTRRDIVINISNKDGGAHIDASLNERYANLTINNSIGWEYTFNDITEPFNNNPAYACIRQIAQEFLITIDWLQSIKSYTRRKTNVDMIINYINSYLYIYEENKNDGVTMKLFEDNRITNKEYRGYYRDDIIFTNNLKAERYVIF